jgi:hypothetical protein
MFRNRSLMTLPILALFSTLLLIRSTESCSIFCEDGKIPCGGYGSTCEGFKGCVFPGECSGSSGSNNGPATVPTNYDVIRPFGNGPATVPTNYNVIRPFGPTRATSRPNRRYRPSYNRPSYRRRYSSYFGKYTF